MRQRMGLFACQWLGWHPQRYRKRLDFNGNSFRSRCARCGFVGLEDSHGALF